MTVSIQNELGFISNTQKHIPLSAKCGTENYKSNFIIIVSIKKL